MTFSSGRPRRDPHGWNRWGNYLQSHFGHIQRLLDEGFLGEDLLSIAVSGVDLITIEGKLVCEHGLEVSVTKALDVQGDRVRTFKYSYHAAFSDPHRRIFRYDNAHPWPHHADAHHKHVYSPPGSPEPGRVTWVGYDDWPSLFDVVQELRDWWEETGQYLDPDRLPIDPDVR